MSVPNINVIRLSNAWAELIFSRPMVWPISMRPLRWPVPVHAQQCDPMWRIHHSPSLTLTLGHRAIPSMHLWVTYVPIQTPCSSRTHAHNYTTNIEYDLKYRPHTAALQHKLQCPQSRPPEWWSEGDITCNCTYSVRCACSAVHESCIFKYTFIIFNSSKKLATRYLSVINCEILGCRMDTYWMLSCVWLFNCSSKLRLCLQFTFQV